MNSDNLKRKALEILSKKDSLNAQEIKDLDMNKLLHEIDVYQAELEVQNEELLKIEANLRELLKLNQQLFDEAPFPYLCLDEKFAIVNANYSSQKAFSMPLLNREFNSFYKFIAKGNLNTFMNWVAKKEYEYSPLELKLNAHGEIRYFKIYLKKLGLGSNYYLLNLIDIHNEYLLKEETRKNNQVLYEIAQYQSDMLITIDKNYKIKFANSSFLNFFDVDSIDRFINNYKCLCFTFLKKDGFFHSDHNGENHWIDKLKVLDDSKRAVCIYDKKNDSVKTFMVNISVTSVHDKICTFSEITEFSLQKEEFRKKSYTDELTKIYNRAKFNEFLEYEFPFFYRGKVDLVMIMFDIDFFKDINDTYGHDIGDEVLIELCELTKHYVRKADIFARWGGEEFVILLKGCTLEQGYNLAEIIRQKIETHIFTNKKIKLTCSFGVSEAILSDSIESFTKKADLMLYSAKEDGRNCVKC